MDNKLIKSTVESLLFINEKPIEMNELRQILETDKKETVQALEELIQEYKQRKSGVCIVKVAGGYQMCSAPENEPWVKRMCQERSKQKLSIASLETLAIVAYKQPITRIEIEAIRGVNIDGVMRKLSELGLVKIIGRKDVVGKPFLYATTRKFLEYFGINSLMDLPKLEDFIALAEKEKIPSNCENNSDENVAAKEEVKQ
ncbi:MAG: SMC-Scp complex subunit ScpB [Omnitrophica bacterium]|nr:SMC-Scp complex subunit ScpB [Candidatus Omnitrophota bacterium]